MSLGRCERTGRKERQWKRGTEMHTERDVHKKEPERRQKKASSRVFLGGTLHLCVLVHSGRRSDLSRQESIMESSGEEELQKLGTNVQRSRALPGGLCTIYHFSVLRARF